MRNRFGWLVAFACGLFGLADDAFAQRRVALVMGNSAYQQASALPNPGNDAASISAMLKSAGFDVVDSRRDLGINDMRRAIREFADKVRNSDVAVVFYAGHGIEVDGVNYLIPVDAVLDRDVDVEDETISLDRILRILEPAKRLRLVILDACRDNPFGKKMQRTLASRSVGRGLAKVEPTSSDTLIAFAAKAGSTAADGEGKNSPFTLALMQNIAEPGLDLRIAFGKVRDEVLQRTNNRQEPFVYGSLGGSTVSLVPQKEKPKAEVAALPPMTAPANLPAPSDPAAEMRRDYEFAERVGTKEAWDSFLAVHTSGLYANLAKAHRAKLEAATAVKNVVAAVTPAALTKPDEQIVQAVQAEMRRVGCYVGAVDGDWNDSGRKALELFNKFAGMRLEVKTVSKDTIEVLRERTSRVCPLVCASGMKPDGDRCVEDVKTAARPDPNAAVRNIAPAAPLTPGAPAAAPKAAPATRQSEQVVCDSRGCRSAPANCKVVTRQGGGGMGDQMVCN